MESKPQKEKKKEEELMDLIYNEKKYIFDYYSIHDLLSLIHYAKEDKNKIFYLLDNFTKEEIMKSIEENITLSLSKKNSSMNSDKKITKRNHQIEKFTLVSKTMTELQEKGDLTNSEENHIIWKFIHQEGINLIDLYDALKSFDKNKLFNKVKEEINEKNKKNGIKDKITSNIALINELNKRFEKKENKIYDYYINNFEENDIYYLKKTGQWKYYSKTMKEKSKNTINENNNSKLYDLLIKVSKNQRLIIFSFMDIFTLGKFALCNKKLYNLIFKEFNLNANSAKVYVSSIFANSNLYQINTKKIKEQYKNSFLEMFKNKLRIKFCGIYYARVKIIKEFSKYGVEHTNNGFLVYYRILRFFPNGEVYAMTSPHFKNYKIRHAVKDGGIEFKKGKFKIDEEDNVLVKYTNGDEYKYRLGWSDFSIYRLGYKHDDPGVKNGIELLSYEMVDKYGGKTSIKLDENFPRRFRFRNLEYLKNDIFIHKYEEVVEEKDKIDEINLKKDNISNNTIATISTEENSINENNN